MAASTDKPIKIKRSLYGFCSALVFIFCSWWLSPSESNPFAIEEVTTDHQALTLNSIRNLPVQGWASVEPQRNSHIVNKHGENWLRVRIPKGTVEQNYILEIATPFLRKVDFILFEGDTQLDSLQIGNDRPFADRRLKYYNQAFPFTQSSVHDRTIYIHVDSEILLYLPINIAAEHVFTTSNVTKYMVLGLCLGMFLGVLIYNLSLALALRDKIYSYFVIYECFILSIIVLYGGYIQMIWPIAGEHFDLYIRGFTIVMALMFLPFIMFLRLFLEFRTHSPASYRYSKHVMAGAVVLALANCFIPVRLAAYITTGFVTFGTLLLLIRFTFRIHVDRVYFTFLSFLGLMTCEFIHFMTLLGIFPTAPHSYYISAFGGVLEALFLSMAVSNRISLLQNERNEIIHTLKGHAPANRLNEILGSTLNSELEHAEVNVAIMFIDIVDFSQISEILKPKAVLRHLSQAMTEINTIIASFHGSIDRSIGDGVLCFFGYHENASKEHHATLAFKAAKQIQELIVSKFQYTSKSDTFVLPVRIGIHVDDVIIADIGGKKRIDFTMIGNGVNFANRLESACSPFKILLSSECYHCLSREESAIPGFSPIHIAIKHQVKLVEAFEFNPFHARPEPLARVERLHLEQIHIRTKEQRFTIPGAQVRSEIVTELGRYQVVDYSLRGLRVVGAKQIGKKVTMLVDLTTDDAATNQKLRRLLLNQVTVEVRWSKVNGADLYEHGLRFIGLNDHQSKFIFESMQALHNDTQRRTGS